MINGHGTPGNMQCHTGTNATIPQAHVSSTAIIAQLELYVYWCMLNKTHTLLPGEFLQ